MVWSYKSQYDNQLIYASFVVVWVRNAIRIFDFENTKEQMGDRDWNILVWQQGNFCVVSMIFATISFIHIRFKGYVSFSQSFILVLSARIDKKKWLVYEGFWFAFIIVLSHYLSNKLNETLIQQS